MKFKVVERKKKGLYGASALQKHFQKNKEWEDYKKKVADEKEKAEKEKKEVKEQTVSGAGYPTATDGAGNQAVDKTPSLLGKTVQKKIDRKKKIKTIMARRAKLKI